MIRYVPSDELLAALRCHGAELFADGQHVRFRARAGALPADLKAEASRRRDELLSLLAAPAVPPPGALLFLSDEDGLPCKPDDCFMWTWTCAPAWFYTRERPLPPLALAVSQHYKGRCRRCVAKGFRVSVQTFSNGAKHLRCECDRCGGFVGHLKPPPDNVDLEYRAT